MQSTRGALTTAARDPPRDGPLRRRKHARAPQPLSLSWTHHRPLLPPERETVGMYVCNGHYVCTRAGLEGTTVPGLAYNNESLITTSKGGHLCSFSRRRAASAPDPAPPAPRRVRVCACVRFLLANAKGAIEVDMRAGKAWLAGRLSTA